MCLYLGSVTVGIAENVNSIEIASLQDQIFLLLTTMT